ncbi:MAG TPA: serine protein kinase PrkA [Polyangia bacterium]|nr:serine protein kinase PrkA [Polyangia bacterium]
MTPGEDGERDSLSQIGQEVRDSYTRNKRVMSFDEFFQLFLARPEQYARNVAQYLKDVFDHFGSEEIKTPRGTFTRWKLFDLPFDGGRDRLIGQEEVQARVYRVISNFVREGTVNKLVLLHGPNGSAKSTFVSCIVRALEYYSTLDEGALYRFNWIFPSQKLQKGGLGFGGGFPAGGMPASGSYDGRSDTFAYLDEDMVDAKLVDELRDNPLLLIPPKRRQQILDDKLRGKAFDPSDYIRFGDLGHKNKQIFEALLVAYKGDYLKVLRHVQVERFYIARRYRQAAVTVEPQLAVDAQARQLTMDRSLGALPTALQSVALYEYSGELVDGNRGLIEYSDLLKRPLEAYKYLLGTVEHAEVAVQNTIVFCDQFFIGSSNESHLAVFKEVPEFQSFKGRLELIRVPYILDYEEEQKIYEEQIHDGAVGRHIAPHTAFVAALWATLTRMRKPLPEKYPKGLADLVAKLTPLEKAELYAHGRAPDGLTPEQTKDLLGNIDKIWGESDAYPNYEGRTGASPREVKVLLLNAAQHGKFTCVSPLAVFEEMEELVKNVTVYEFLKQEPLPGGYHENKKFIYIVREKFLDIVDDEVRSSMGLVEERQYADLFGKYVTHVSHWTKKEKLRNPLTGRLDDPDEDMMTEVEKTLGMGQKRDDFRHEVISRIAAWSIEHPGQKIDFATVFPRQLQQLREAYFDQRKKILKKTLEEVLQYLADGADKVRGRLDREAFERVETTLRNLKTSRGYCEHCARDAVSYLLRKRYA